MSYHKRKFFIIWCCLETSSGQFCAWKELSTTLLKNAFLKQVDHIGYVIAKLKKIFQAEHADFLRFPFTEDSLKIKKQPGFHTTFYIEFFDVFFYNIRKTSSHFSLPVSLIPKWLS